MPEGNLFGRLTALALIVGSLVWVGRFTGRLQHCSFCPTDKADKPAAVEPSPAQK